MQFKRNWKFVAAVAAVASLYTIPAFAQSFELGVASDSKNNTLVANMVIPVQQQDKKTVSAVIGMQDSETSLGSEDDAGYHPYGRAEYLVLGAQASTTILNQHWLAAFVRATADVRLNGSTKYSVYSQETGKSYNPSGGVNAAFGIAVKVLPHAAIATSYVKNLDHAHESMGLVTLRFQTSGRASAAE